MKLHLPKLLRNSVLACITAVAGVATAVGTTTFVGGAVLFALSTQQAWADDWVNDGNGRDSYYIISTDTGTVDAYGAADGRAFYQIKAAENHTEQITINNLILRDSGTALFMWNWQGSTNMNLLVENLKVGQEGAGGACAIEIEANQTLTINSIASESQISTLTNAGTLSLGVSGSAINLSGTINNTGTLNLNGNATVAEGNTLNLNGSATLNGSITNKATITLGATLNGSGSVTNEENCSIQLNADKLNSFERSGFSGQDTYEGSGYASHLVVFGAGINYDGEVSIGEQTYSVINGKIEWDENNYFINSALTYSAEEMGGAGTLVVSRGQSLTVSENVSDKAIFLSSGASLALGEDVEVSFNDADIEENTTIDLSSGSNLILTNAGTITLKNCSTDNKLDENGQYVTGAGMLTVGSGTTIKLNNTAQYSQGAIAGSVTVLAGGVLELSGNKSLLGYGNNATKSVTLKGEEGKLAKMILSTSEMQHISSQVYLQGNSEISATGTGYLVSYDNGKITATGTNNTISSQFKLEKALTVEVTGASDELTISGLVYSAANGSDPRSLTKDGEGTLTLSGANTYVGGTTINAGTLKLGNSSALGSGSVTVNNGATLDVNGKEDVTNAVILAEGATLQNGSSSGIGTSNMQFPSIELQGNATVVTDSKFGMLQSSHGQANLNLGGYTLTKKGTGTFFLSRTAVTAGTLEVLEGNIQALEAGSGDDVGTLNLSAATVKVGTLNDNQGTFDLDATKSINALQFDGGKVDIAEGVTLTVDNPSTTDATNDGTTTVTSKGGEITGSGSADLGTLTLEAGATLTAAGSLTIGALNLDLSSYTNDYSKVHTLVSAAGGLSLTEGVLDNYTNVSVGDYTATVTQSGNSLQLTYTAPLEIIDASLESEMLTLNVNVDLLSYDFTNGGQIIIPGISDSMMAKILGLEGLPADGMVGITLVGTDGEENAFTATGDQQIGFLGKDGESVYWGSQVDGVGWQYQVNYIPEPATATLSLLALAGLAARRRRK